MNGSNVTDITDPPPYIYYTIKELDIVIGTFYLLFGLFGICSNGSVLWQFWTARSTVKVYPFTLCALVLAANDLLLCTLGVSPYAVLILAKRPQASSFPAFLCKVFGFVNHFCDRFAWFNITCIMVFRCVITVFTLRLRSITYHPFIYILSLLALLQGIICILPFFDLDMVEVRYDYFPNYGECIYGVDGSLAPGMVVLIDVLWWGPFLACILSCVVFFIFMKLHAKRTTSVRESDKSADAKKKTALLTSFFIICYLPKALLILFDFLISTERYISWPWFYEVMGDHVKALRLYVYLNLMCKWVVPAGRAAFTPTMLRLQTYIKGCDTSRRSKASSVVSGVSLIKSKLFKIDTQQLLKRDSDNEVTTKLKENKSQPIWVESHNVACV